MTTTQPINQPTKDTLITALYRFIAQRPGLEYGNYGDISSYRAEMRSITKDRHHAQALLRYIELSSSISAPMILDALSQAFSGRLSWDDTKQRLDYCTGQYFPTEYRKAVAAVCSYVLWSWYRDGLPKDTEHKGDRISKWARKEFGRAIGQSYFR
jgi:hypothetical protein